MYKKILKKGLQAGAKKLLGMAIEKKILGTVEPKPKKEKKVEKGWLEKKIVNITTDDGERQIVKLDDSVCFVPVTTDGVYILGEQFRAAEGSRSITTYGGYMDKEDKGNIKVTAIRECYEECNIAEEDISRVEVLYEGLYPAKGICSEKNSLVLIHLNKKYHELDVKSNDPHESISPYPVTSYKKLTELELNGMKTHIFKLCLQMIEVNELSALKTKYAHD